MPKKFGTNKKKEEARERKKQKKNIRNELLKWLYGINIITPH